MQYNAMFEKSSEYIFTQQQKQCTPTFYLQQTENLS